MNDLGELQKYFEPIETRPFGEVVKSYTYFSDGDVICAKITPCFENGKLGVARNLTNGVGFGSSEFVVMRSNGSLVPEFLFYYLSRDEFREVGATLMSGAVGHKRVPNSYFEDLPIPLPPLDKQKRIVAILDQAFAALDRARANAEANLADTSELATRCVEEKLSVGELGPLEPLGGHVDLLSGFAFKSGGYSDDETDIRIIRGDNIVQGRFRWDGVKRWPMADRAEYARYELAEDDLLIAMDRTWVSAGIKYAVVSEDALPSLLVQRVARLRARPSILPRYLSYWIGSKAFERYVLSIQTGLGVPHVSGKQIEDFEVRVPPVALQSEIADSLDAISNRSEALLSEYGDELSNLAALRQSLLEQAFSGRLS